jgi:hypothetical protein
MRSWKRPVAAIAGITILVDLSMVFTDMGPDLGLVTALCVVLGVGLWFISDLMNVTIDPADMAIGSTPASAESTDRRVMRLRSGIVYGQRGSNSLERLRTTLVDLVDDQLRAAHQIDRGEDPDAARAVLGDDLYAFVDDPGPADELADPRQLDRIVTLIEQI